MLRTIFLSLTHVSRQFQRNPDDSRGAVGDVKMGRVNHMVICNNTKEISK